MANAEGKNVAKESRVDWKLVGPRSAVGVERKDAPEPTCETESSGATSVKAAVEGAKLRTSASGQGIVLVLLGRPGTRTGT